MMCKHKLSKYTKKFIDEIRNNNFSLKKININLKYNVVVKKITDVISETYSEMNYINCKKTCIPKLHNKNDFPLIYVLFCGIYEKIKKFDNIPNIVKFNDFVKWFRLEPIKKRDIFGSNEDMELYNFIYNKKPHDRQELNELLYDNNFVSLDIQQHAETENLIKSIYEMDNINLVLYEIENKPSINVNKIIHIIKFMRSLLCTNMEKKKEKMEIIIFAGYQKKLFPKNSKYLCPDNINSGSTGNKIMIWRKEELNKVLIHELIHFFRIDYYSVNEPFIENYLINTYNIMGIDSSNESYTEALAILIHSIYYSIYTKCDLQWILDNELTFTMFQIGKILDFYNFDNINELGYKPIYQKTSVLSYFIVKGSLLFNLKNFLEFQEKKGKKEKKESIIRSLKNKTEISQFYELIVNSMHRNYFNNLNEYLINIKQNKNTNIFIYKSLRLSLFG
jgi:hypothetical protein